MLLYNVMTYDIRSGYIPVQKYERQGQIISISIVVLYIVILLVQKNFNLT